MSRMRFLKERVVAGVRTRPSPSPRPSPLGRGGRISSHASMAETHPLLLQRVTFLPLPKGEGQGEGEQDNLLSKTSIHFQDFQTPIQSNRNPFQTTHFFHD